LAWLRSQVLIAALAAAAMVGAWPASVASGQKVSVHADPRIELLTVVFRMAKSFEYDQCLVPAYAAAIDSAFAKYRDHAAVREAIRLRDEQGVGFDAVPRLALSLTDPPALAERPLADSAAGGMFDPGRPGPHYRRFVALLREFVRDTRFMDFYHREDAILRAASNSLERLIQTGLHPEWFTAFYGPRAGSQFIAIPGTCNGGTNYGPHIDLKGGRHEIYAVIGVSDTSPKGLPQLRATTLPVIVHEFAHSFANPFIERHLPEMNTASMTIYAGVHGMMARQAYDNGPTMLKESLVRATVVRYRRANEGAAGAEAEMREQFGRGFIWIRGLDSVLARFEAQRSRYRTFEAFMPEVVAFFNDVASGMPERLRQLDAARPKILSLSPADSAVDVDFATSSLVIRFDRPMSGAYSFSRPSGKGEYPSLGSGAWNDERTALTMGVQLKPGQSYDLRITGTGFQTPDGVPLADRGWHFQTRPPPQ